MMDVHGSSCSHESSYLPHWTMVISHDPWTSSPISCLDEFGAASHHQHGALDGAHVQVVSTARAIVGPLDAHLLTSGHRAWEDAWVHGDHPQCLKIGEVPHTNSVLAGHLDVHCSKWFISLLISLQIWLSPGLCYKSSEKSQIYELSCNDSS